MPGIGKWSLIVAEVLFGIAVLVFMFAIILLFFPDKASVTMQ